MELTFPAYFLHGYEKEITHKSYHDLEERNSVGRKICVEERGGAIENLRLRQQVQQQ